MPAEFPEMQGLSPRNRGYRKAFAEAWPNESILQQLAAKLPWFHNCVLLDKVKTPSERAWYVDQAIQNGWSRNVLVMQIESGLYQRQGKALTNFQPPFPRRSPASRNSSSRDPCNPSYATLEGV